MLEQLSSQIPSSMWASMNSWFTPAVFFVLLNLMIGTIALTSTLAKKNPNSNPPPKSAGSVLQRLKSTNLYTHFNRSQDPEKNPDSGHYFFQENSVQVPQVQPIYKQAPETEHAGNLEPGAHYFFQENLQVSQSQVPELNPQTHFVSRPKDSILGDFERAHEEKVEENEPAQSMDEVFSRLTGGHFSRTKSDTEPASGKAAVKLPTKMKKSASVKSAFGHFEEEEIVEARRPATVREGKGKGKGKAADGDVEVDAKADDFINRFKQQLQLQRMDSIVRWRGSGGR